jgi:uncharacterized protein DUF2752
MISRPSRIRGTGEKRGGVDQLDAAPGNRPAEESPPPLSVWRWERVPPGQRLILFLNAGAVVLIYAIAVWLTPDPRGVGTHEQLGLPPCQTLALFGFPCPFCGMTTAFTHMARGQVWEAVRVQPAGALGFIGGGAFLIGCVVFALTGRWPAGVAAFPYRKPTWIAVLTLLAVAWTYKILEQLLS